MKKIVPIIVIAVVALSVACKKDPVLSALTETPQNYSCSCFTTTTMDGETDTSTYVATIQATKSQAQMACSAENTSQTSNSNGVAYSIKTTCSLK